MFIETVGVGQSEVEAAALVDTLVYVASPGTGDWLQFMKAGVLEAPDVFVVNKADLGAAPARRPASSRAVSGSAMPAAPSPSPAGAPGDPGLGARRHGDRRARRRLRCAPPGARATADALAARRRHSCESWVLDGLERRYGSFGLERCGGREALRARLAARGAASSFALLASLGREIEDALRKPE